MASGWGGVPDDHAVALYVALMIALVSILSAAIWFG
jgi:hypothetical protein